MVDLLRVSAGRGSEGPAQAKALKQACTEDLRVWQGAAELRAAAGGRLAISWVTGTAIIIKSDGRDRPTSPEIAH